MSSEPIPVIEIRGSHRQVGQQIGELNRPRAQALRDDLRNSLPGGVSLEQMLDKGRLCLAHTRNVYPQYVDEISGIAEAMGVSVDELFLSFCEELWEPPTWRFQERGCTDMAARGPATADGSALLAHTNDLGPEAEAKLVILRIQAGDEPEFLGISAGGLGFSAGFNAAGIGLTGNEVSSNDVRPGVPRLLMVRAILAARRLEEAMDVCLLPQRASNYNNILGDPSGEIYSMEGSATDCEPIYIADNILAHANHYVSAPMRNFEADRNLIAGSVIRYNRCRRLLQDNYGLLTPELFKTLLADHVNYPASVCKHGSTTVTAFGLIINLTERRAWIGRGRPCETQWTEHSLAPWSGALPGVLV